MTETLGEPGDTARPGSFTRGTGVAMSPVQLRTSTVAAILLVLAGVFTLKGFLPALAWAVVFAIGLWPLYQRLERRWPGHPERLAGLFVLGVLLVFVIPLTLVTVPLVSDAHDMVAWVAKARAQGVPPPPVLATLPFGDRIVPVWQRELGQPGSISALASHAMQGGLLTTGRAVGAEAVHRLVLLGFMLLTLFFLLRDADDVVEQFRIGSGRAFGPAGEDVGRQIIRSIHGTVNGLVLVGLGEGVILGVAYAVAGTPHPTLFGLFTALLAMVPFGAAIAFLIAAAVTLAAGNTVAAIVIVALGFVVTFVADHFIRPVLIGGATRLPFLWVLLGILGGVESWGLVGLFVGPAIMAALVLLWREWVGSQKGPLNPPADLPR
ncbi:MAG: AI-2E family transporter [Janthinobacterium lividum]